MRAKYKVDWDVDPEGLLDHAQQVGDLALERLRAQGIEDETHLPLFARRPIPEPTLRTLAPEASKLLLRNSISPLPLHKVLELLEVLQGEADLRFLRHERLALAKALVFRISNLEFGPEVGVGPPKTDAPVVVWWLDEVRGIVRDLRGARDGRRTSAVVHCADSRDLTGALPPRSVDAVITSPPYPNEKDYTRTTRLESVLLGFIRSKEDLRSLKRALVRSNTRAVYKGDNDDLMVAGNRRVGRIAAAIERRRVRLGKNSGFERLYPRVAKLYFGGMARHLANLRGLLKLGASLAYVVGDQASYLRVMIRTGRILAGVAQSLGYEVIGIDLFRTRLATATREQLREEVVLLRWPGRKARRGPPRDTAESLLRDHREDFPIQV